MKDALILEHKTYISARRAAEVTGYTSDYVGQLCRAGKIESKVVGRSWFVLEESLLNHKLVNDQVKTNKKTAKKRRDLQAQQERREIREEKFRTIEKLSPPLLLLTERAYSLSVQPIIVSKIVEEAKSSFKYEPIKSPLMPLLKKKNLEVKFVPAVFSIRNTFSSISISNKITSYNFADDFAAVVILLVAIIGGGFFMQSSLSSLNQNTNYSSQASIASVSKDILNSIAKGWDQISNKVASYFGKDNSQLVVENIPSQKDSRELGFNGIAVVPSTNSLEKDELIKQRIRDSFSDEIQIHPDQSGTSGVITPVFRKATEDNFVYVLVPIQEATQ